MLVVSKQDELAREGRIDRTQGRLQDDKPKDIGLMQAKSQPRFDLPCGVGCTPPRMISIA